MIGPQASSRSKRVGLLIWNCLAIAQRAILIATSSFIIILVFSGVMMRYLFHYPGMEVEEIATLVAFWLYFTGAIYGSYERTHIKAEVIHLVVKNPRAYIWVKSIASLIVFILVIIMCYWGYTFFMWGLEKRGRSPVLQMPMVYAQSSIFFGAVLMSFYFFVELVDNLRQALGFAPLSKVGKAEDQ